MVRRCNQRNIYLCHADTGTSTEALKKDKIYRRYASGVERALSLFDTALQEWADYISFLGRLLKVADPQQSVGEVRLMLTLVTSRRCKLVRQTSQSYRISQ